MTNLDSILKSRDITLPTKVHLVKAMVFPVVMYGCESWTVKKAEGWRIDAFELWCWRRLESLMDRKEIQPVHSKWDQSWVFFGRNDAKAETPVLWPPHAKSWVIRKDPDAGRDWGQEEKGMTEDEMAGWHHWLDGHESEWTQGAGDGQGGLVCCDSWGRKESDTTERLNWTELSARYKYWQLYCIIIIWYLSYRSNCITIHKCLKVACCIPQTYAMLHVKFVQTRLSTFNKVTLKILQTRLQQYMNHEISDVQAGFRKGRGTRDQIANIAGSSKKQESSRKTSISALLTMPKPLTVWITINCGNIWKRWEYQTAWPASWETYMQVRKQQLELDMEQQTGSK